MVVKKKPTKKVTKTPKKGTKTTTKTSKTTKKATKIVVKKASKPTKKSTAKKALPAIKKTNRGRPKKEFKLKHKRIAEKKTTTQEKKTNTKITMHTIPKAHKIKNSKDRRDRSILYLFVFSVILFAFSLGVSFFKKSQVKEIINTPTTIEDTTIQDIVPEEKVTTTNASEQLENLYIAINSKNFEEAYEQLDRYLRNTSTIRTYFSEKRLTTFIDNLNDGIIHISNVQEEQINDYSTKVTYTVDYTLLAGSSFTEEWSVKIVTKDGEQEIAALRCETSGCSRMPFFNPKKYNIK